MPARKDTGLLLIYALDPLKAEIGLNRDDPVIAFGISFPGSDVGVKVEYKVNSVMVREWESDYGSSE